MRTEIAVTIPVGAVLVVLLANLFSIRAVDYARITDFPH
jgi:hypothetical protein